jgi:hypothetical protein
MAPEQFKHRTMAAKLNLGGKSAYQQRLEALFRKSLNRMRFEAIGWCWDVWLSRVREAKQEEEWEARREADEARTQREWRRHLRGSPRLSDAH